MFANDGLAMAIDAGTWTIPGIFGLIASAGVDADEMRRTFNLGVGMVMVVAAEQQKAALDALPDAWRLGEIVPRTDAAVEFRD